MIIDKILFAKQRFKLFKHQYLGFH